MNSSTELLFGMHRRSDQVIGPQLAVLKVEHLNYVVGAYRAVDVCESLTLAPRPCLVPCLGYQRRRVQAESDDLDVWREPLFPHVAELVLVAAVDEALFPRGRHLFTAAPRLPVVPGHEVVDHAEEARTSEQERAAWSTASTSAMIVPWCQSSSSLERPAPARRRWPR